MPNRAAYSSRRKSRAARRLHCSARRWRAISIGGIDPIGQELRIRNVPFRVIGVMSKKGQSTWGQDQDDVVFVPLNTARQRVLGRNQANARAVGSIYVKVRDGENMALVEDEVKQLAASAASAAGQSGRRLLDPQSRRYRRDPRSQRAHAGAAARRGRRRLACGRRHRHHEHHAGVGDRAHPRDRIAARASARGNGTSCGNSCSRRPDLPRSAA